MANISSGAERSTEAAFPMGEARTIPRSFYLDPPEIVAPKLVGKLLVRKASGAGAPELVGRIVEVEAYFGDADPAAHSFVGKTARNGVLFGPPGHAYVYFIYGVHYCLNVSCEPDGRAGCVLIRALEPLAGLDWMAGLRRQEAKPGARRAWQGGLRPAALTSGPGRLCQAFGIIRERDNGADFTSASSSLQIQDDGFLAAELLVTPRIGITKAVDRPARFVLAGSAFASRRRP